MNLINLHVCQDCLCWIANGDPDMGDRVHEEFQDVHLFCGWAFPDDWQGSIGTVSHGTLRPVDLRGAFEAECAKLEIDLPAPPDAGDDEELVEYVDELIDLLNDAAPDGFYFGARFGDGSEFGFWQLEDEGEFSWGDCETCGCKPGNRYRACFEPR